MPNLRIIYQNVVDGATITASTTAGSLGVNNLKTDIKSEVHRSTGTSVTYTVVLPSSQIIGGVALPFCNLTSSATMRVLGYADVAGASLLFDTGAQLACANAPLGSWDWGALPLGVNAFSYGLASYGRIWFAQTAVRKFVVDVADPSNPAGYLDHARMFAGAFWEATYNANYGAKVLPRDTSEHRRSASGDLHTKNGIQYNAISVDLSHMPPDDRLQLWRILRGNGKRKPVFFSLTPQAADTVGDQTTTIWGKLSEMSDIVFSSYNAFDTQITIEEM